MKLSEAILLGDSLKQRDEGIFLSPDRTCGCAIGGAALAVGFSERSGVVAFVEDTWPWLTESQSSYIGALYMLGVRIEQIAEYVRSIEPDDSQPAPVTTEEQMQQEVA